jgi:hypothetical protein
VRADVPRTYYIGVASAMPAVPGFPPPVKALCFCPRGLEEGSAIAIPSHELQLRVGAPASFRFMTSTTRNQDRPGDAIEDWEDDIEEISPVEVTLPGESEDERVRVTLHAKVTEVGVLELWCQEVSGERSWKLEYSVRETDA